MAKIIYDIHGNATGYEPGVIYDLGFIVDGKRTPFYVGETSNPEQRLKDHKRAGKNATNESTLVYQTINAFNKAGIEWTMEILAEFGSEGPTDLEDEWIMHHLYKGYKLCNMKKGNANWLSERENVASDMRRRGISSFRKYREVLSAEAKQAEADRKHARWMKEEAEAQAHNKIVQLKAEKAKRALEEAERAQAEVIRQKEIARQRKEAAKAAADAKWKQIVLPAKQEFAQKQNACNKKNNKNKRGWKLLEKNANGSRNKHGPSWKQEQIKTTVVGQTWKTAFVISEVKIMKDWL